MEIITPGNVDRLKKVKEFQCETCGCILRATKAEYQTGSQYNQTYYYCKCPTCDQYVYIEGKY